MRYRVLTVVALVALAGCGSLAGGLAGGGPTVSDAQVEMQDGSPVLAFNYSVSDYSDALLEGPSGEVISRGTLEPNATESTLALSSVQGGEYKMIVQQGGSTEATLSEEFSAPNATITSAEGIWDAHRLRGSEMTVTNSGELPSHVSTVSASLAGAEISSEVGVWVLPGETESIRYVEEFEEIRVQSAGVQSGMVTARTTNHYRSHGISRTFTGPNLTVTDVSADWDGRSLRSVEVTVENSGDIPTSDTVTVSHDGTELLSSKLGDVLPGETASVELNSGFDRYEPESAGQVSLTAAVDDAGGSGMVFTHDVPGAEITFGETSTTWYEGQLSKVDVNYENEAAVDTSVTVRLIVNGEVVETREEYIPASGSDGVLFSSLFGYLYPSEDGKGNVVVEIDPQYGETVRTTV